ncbi:MAG: transporter substrate-binding domain-containing protein [Lachnospiraceae bacterium]|nr:transporter substrate-binding domain-containing protein [Lachnospiraceae bacterium]
MKRKVLLSIVILSMLMIAISAAFTLNSTISIAASENFDKVKVGIVEQKRYFSKDEDGYEVGFDAEFLMNICTTARLEPEFTVYQNYEELLSALEKGEVQMSVGVSKTPEREEKFIYANTAFSESAVAISVPKDDEKYSYNDPVAVNNMRIGYTKGSVQGTKVLAWAEANKSESEIIEYNTDQDLIDALHSGEIDGAAIATPDAFDLKRIFVYSYTGYYPVFNKNETILCQRVNAAMASILGNNQNYSEKLSEKYNISTKNAQFEFTESEKKYIRDKKMIKVAAAAFDPPYSYLDKDQNVTGITVDFYKKMSEKTGLNFIYLPYDDQKEAVKAVSNGTADVIGIVCSDPIQIDKMGLMLTDVYSEQELYLINENGNKKTDKIAAINSDRDYIAKLYEYRGLSGNIVPYGNMVECFKALKKKEVDALICDMPENIWLMNNYQFTNFTVESTDGLSYFLQGAVRKENVELVEVLNKASRLARHDMNEIISRQGMQEESLWTVFRKMSLKWQLLLMTIIIGFFYSILFMMVRTHNMRITRDKMSDIAENERQINEMMSTAVDSAEMILWEINLKSGELKLFKTPYTTRAMGMHEIPECIPSAVEYVTKMTTKGHAATVQHMFESMCDGIEQISEVIPFKIKGSDDTIPVKITCIGVKEENGKPAVAYGSCKNIAKEVKKQDDYEEELTYFKRFADKDLKRKLRCDISANRVLNSVPLREEFEGMSYSEIFKHEGYIRTTEGEKIDEKLSVQRLLIEYSKGERKFALEYSVRDGGVSRYLHTDVVLVENPENGHIEMFLYAKDSTESVIEQMIVNRMTTIVYEYVSIIEVFSKKVTEIGFVDKEPIVEKWTYEESLLRKADKYVPEKYREEVKNALSYNKVKEELEANGTYVYSYTVLPSATGTGKTGRQMIQYSYLDDEKTMIFLGILDITMQYEREKESMEKLEKALEEANKANKAKSEFISRISHDIRTPIGIVKNLAAFAREDIHDEAMLNKDLDQIEASGRFLLSLINDVLDISKVDSGKISLRYEPYSYSEYIRNVKNMIEPMCIDKHQEYEIIREDDFEGYVMADKARVNQVVLNIISNAVKYTPEGGKIIYRSHNEEIGGNKIKYRFSVIDNGIGMSEEFQKHLFEDFMQETDNPLRPEGVSGTGLGMSIVKKMVELMNGTIHVKSMRGKGTTVTIEYVFDMTDYTPTNLEAAAKEEKLSGKILIAEDNAINYQIVNRILTKFGLENTWAKNGKKAVEIFESSPEGEFGAILMDVQMPEMDGLEATRRIRSSSKEEGKQIRIIAMTADAFDNARQEGMEAGMDEYLTKPLNAEKLREALERALWDKKINITS